MTRCIFLIGLLCLSAGANAKECTKMEAFAAESVAVYVSSWEEAYFAFIEFGHCDDGAIAEGFSEKISLLWSEHWETLPEMYVFFNKSSKFRAFVMRRVHDETVPEERWSIIRNNAKNNCSEVASNFCVQVLK